MYKIKNEHMAYNRDVNIGGSWNCLLEEKFSYKKGSSDNNNWRGIRAWARNCQGIK
jgi:hypothetical protein